MQIKKDIAAVSLLMGTAIKNKVQAMQVIRIKNALNFRSTHFLYLYFLKNYFLKKSFTASLATIRSSNT